jgi:hypothetical protein
MVFSSYTKKINENGKKQICFTVSIVLSKDIYKEVFVSVDKSEFTLIISTE